MPNEVKSVETPEKNEWVFYSPSGDKIREFFKWNPEMTELVKVGEEDIQEAINERAKGCTITEQIERLARGDNSVLRPGDGIYGDVSGFPETTGEMLHHMENQTIQEYAKLQAQKNAAKEKGDSDLSSKIEKLEKELAELKGFKTQVEGESK